MKCRNLFFVLALWVLCSGSNKNYAREHTILDENILKAYQKIEETISVKRTPLLFIRGKSADNCRSYFDLISQHEIVDTTYNHVVKAEYVVCDVLKILADSTPFLGKSDRRLIGLKLLFDLDLRSFPNSLRQINENSYTFNSLFPNNWLIDGATITVDTEDWFYSVEVVAVVRANNNSTEDWIVQFVDDSKEGTYIDVQTLIIYDPQKSDLLQATSYP